MSHIITSPTEAINLIWGVVEGITADGLDPYKAIARIKRYADEGIKAASQPIGAVWVKGEYDRLYDQVKGGKRTVCFVDYRYGHVDQEQVCRDICTIDNEGWEFFARGIGYGRLSYAMKKYGMAQDSAFVKICEEMNVEWLDESPTAAGNGKEDAEAFGEFLKDYQSTKYYPLEGSAIYGWQLKSGGHIYTTTELYTIFKNRNNKP
jgi:hypothetical protein